MSWAFPGLTHTVKDYIKARRIKDPEYRLSERDFEMLEHGYNYGVKIGKAQMFITSESVHYDSETRRVVREWRAKPEIWSSKLASAMAHATETAKEVDDDWYAPGLRISTGSINGLGHVHPKEHYPLHFDDDGFLIEEPWCTPEEVIRDGQ